MTRCLAQGYEPLSTTPYLRLAVATGVDLHHPHMMPPEVRYLHVGECMWERLIELGGRGRVNKRKKGATSCLKEKKSATFPEPTSFLHTYSFNQLLHVISLGINKYVARLFKIWATTGPRTSSGQVLCALLSYVSKHLSEAT